MKTSVKNKFTQILAEEIRPGEDTLDDAYQKFAGTNPFLPVTHFIDHATMGAEALVGLNLGHRVKDWISHHSVRPYVPPMTGVSISANWEQMLGRPESHGDWLHYFENELRDKSFQGVLRQWVPRFAHHVGAYLFHGLIRTGHGVRALENKDTVLRRGEVARGLALWAIGVRRPVPAVAIKCISENDVKSEILKVARAGANTFINQPTVPNLHLVTGPMAYFFLADYLDSKTHGRILKSYEETHRHALQNEKNLSAAVSGFSIPILNHDQLESLAEKWDAHPIKLTEATLRAYRLTGDDVFLKAAGRVQSFFPVRGILSTVRFAIANRLGASVR